MRFTTHKHYRPPSYSPLHTHTPPHPTHHSFLYPRHARAASLLANGASHLFALSMPWEGTPDVGDTWNRWQFDADTMAATGGRPISAGFLAGAGAISQLNAWPNSTLATTLGAALVSGNFTPLVTFFATRTAYDAPSTPGMNMKSRSSSSSSSSATTVLAAALGPRTLSIFHRNVAVLLMHQGGRDCIVPGYGPRRGWADLRNAYSAERPHGAKECGVGCCVCGIRRCVCAWWRVFEYVSSWYRR